MHYVLYQSGSDQGRPSPGALQTVSKKGASSKPLSDPIFHDVMHNINFNF